MPHSTTLAKMVDTDTQHRVFLPGSTIGMVGGGQLGRMFAMAASSMGYRVVVFCNNRDEPAAQVAHDCVTGPLDDETLTDRFARQCDVITLEFENIPAETIHRCQQHAPTAPSANVLAIAQDRLIEKTTFRNAGLPVTPFVSVLNSQQVIQAGRELGWPLIVKTARSGYDGKGQHRLNTVADSDSVDWSSAEAWVAEKWIDFQLEISVVVARTVTGQCECFPVFENDHANHILDVTVAPARVPDAIAKRAREIAIEAAESIELVGVLCVEFFVSGDEVMINEVAPRPHNSGHLTIEACETSQFAQHVRAVCNLPLGSTRMRTPAAAMANLLGDLWPAPPNQPDWTRVLDQPGLNLHLYGKRDAKPGRKMGHLTVTGDDRSDVQSRVVSARDRLRAPTVS